MQVLDRPTWCRSKEHSDKWYSTAAVVTITISWISWGKWERQFIELTPWTPAEQISTNLWSDKQDLMGWCLEGQDCHSDRLLWQDLTSWKNNRNLMKFQNRNAKSYTWNRIISCKNYLPGGSSDKRTWSPGETQAECVVHFCSIDSLPCIGCMSNSIASS